MREYRRQRPDDLISASEVAAFAYCREQWRLEYGLGLPAANQAARQAGTQHHGRKAFAERVAGGWIGPGAVPRRRGLAGAPAAALGGGVAMNPPLPWPVVLAVVVLLVGLLLAGLGGAMRRRRGLGSGKTVSLDRVTLTSRRLGLTGRPDRLVKSGGVVIPEEWKSSRRLRDSHRAQLGIYFLLIEDQMGVRPPHGFVVCGDGTRHRIENDDRLREWVLGLVDGIRTARSAVAVPIAVKPLSGQCQSCGQRGNCRQAL